ncbi:MAG: hypothetical protein LBU70_02925 [Chitinispirillales bacterium]|jgi:hypothetical protein|nr:hypothetical protein [Chitinispirillales bacterium]
MIKINLAPSKKKRGRIPRDRRSPGDRRGSGGKIVVALLLLVAGGGGGYYYVVYVMEPGQLSDIIAAVRTGSERTEPAKRPLPPPVPQIESPAARPSSGVRSRMAENVVREIDDDGRAVSKLDLPYADMSAAERINYEVLFGRNIFNMITRNTPPGIRYRTLEIDSFQTIRATGEGSSRQMAREMFAAFKNERGELLPQPHSFIRDGAAGSFTFAIVHRPNFGFEVADPFQAIDHIGFRESLPQHLRTLTQLAGENRVRMSSAPTRISAEKSGDYRRVVYRMAGMTTYTDFHSFVQALYDARVPCAFQKIVIGATGGEQVRVGAEVLFVVRD